MLFFIPGEDGARKLPAAICVICIVTRATEIIAKLGLIWITLGYITRESLQSPAARQKEKLDSAKRNGEIVRLFHLLWHALEFS